MAYNLSYLRNRVLVDKLDDDSIDPGIIDNFLNDTQRSIFNTYELPYMEKIFEGVLPQGEHSFNFPVDYSILESLIITGDAGEQKALTNNYIPFRRFNEQYPTPGNQQAGIPLQWTTFANKLFFDKPTDKDYTLTLFYLKDPETLDADAKVPDLPQNFEEVLVLGAYIRALQRNEDFDLADKAIIEYTRQVTALVSRQTKRQSGSATIMAQPGRALRPLRNRR